MKPIARNCFLVLCSTMSLCADAAAADVGERAIQFDRDIRPILSANCFACHGPHGAKRKGNLRLDTREGLFGFLKDGGRVVVAGQPEQSALLKRVTTADKEEVMPPPKTGKRLTAAQLLLLRRWVELGAPWSPGWTFSPPQLSAPPAVKQSAWPRRDLDRFVLAAIEQRGWHPSPEADRITLIRRLSYDLIGLPRHRRKWTRFSVTLRRRLTSVPELMDLAKEPNSVFELYGEDARKPGTFAANCLLARRLAERGVRFIQLYHRGWDHHDGIQGRVVQECKKSTSLAPVCCVT